MKKLLIVVDMQKDFVDGALGTAEAVAIVERAAKKIRDFDGDCIATLDTHDENYLQTGEGRNLPVLHCIRGTEGWRLAPAIEAALQGKNFSLLEKPTFGSMELPRLIAEEYDINDLSVELIGLCTDICVVTNALLLKTAFPEMPITVDSTCCAGVTPEKHEAALETMRSCQISVC